MHRQLIVNGDDFGLTPGVNSAISECARDGVLRSATLMANGPAFDDAVRKAKDTDRLGVGIHFTLTGLKPLSEPGRLPVLAAGNGRLPSSLSALIDIALVRKEARGEIRRELFAQAEKVFDSGIVPTHFDSHKHVHILPVVVDVLIEIAERYSVKWIRKPFEDPRSIRFFADVEEGSRGGFLKQYLRALCSRPAHCLFRSRIAKSGLRTPDYFHGLSSTGVLSERVMARLAESVKPGINELMVHPGYLDAELRAMNSRLSLSREREREILVSEDTKSLMENRAIQLIHYGEVKL